MSSKVHICAVWLNGGNEYQRMMCAERDISLLTLVRAAFSPYKPWRLNEICIRRRPQHFARCVLGNFDDQNLLVALISLTHSETAQS